MSPTSSGRRGRWLGVVGIGLVGIGTLIVTMNLTRQYRTDLAIAERGLLPRHVDRATNTVHLWGDQPIVPEHAPVASASPHSEPVHSIRDPDEWQGMPVDETNRISCHPEIGCGLGLACVDGRCVGCMTDDDCFTEEEVCVLQHCVLETNADCFNKSECGPDELCILSGVADDPRGNSTTRAYCQSSRSGYPQVMTAEIEALQQNIQTTNDFRPTNEHELVREIERQLQGEP